VTADPIALILRDLGRLVEPLADAAESEQARRALLDSLGWDLEAVTGIPVDELVEAIGAVASQVGELAGDTEPKGLAEVAATLAQIGGAFALLADPIAGLSDKVASTNADEIRRALEGLGGELVELLAFLYLARYHPAVLEVGRLLTLVEAPADVAAGELTPAVADPASGLPQRYPQARPKLRLERLGDLLTNPKSTLLAAYPVDQLPDEQAAAEVASRLFGRVGSLLARLGAEVVQGPSLSAEPGYAPVAVSLVNRTLAFLFQFPLGEPADGDGTTATAGVGAALTLIAEPEGGPALAVAPVGTVGLSWSAGATSIELALTAGIDAFAVGRGGLTLPEGGNVVGVTAALKVTRGVTTPGQPAIRIGGAQGTRLEAGRFGLRMDASLDAERQDFGLLVEVGNVAFLAAAGDGDGFLKKVLPADGLRAPFDFGIGWSKTRGVYFRGGSPGTEGGGPGLSTTVPVPLDLGFLKVPSVYLALAPEEGKITALATANADVKLGPFSASVERLGLRAVLTFPDKGGNLGPVNLAFEFQPPVGVGLAINSQVVTGGGYLFIDHVNRQYAGVLELRFSAIALKAVGLLTTRMPDGSEGFSLFVLISAEFTPIQLGFGFTLSGVGGFLGVNRTIVIDAIRSGLRVGALDSVLFPKDLAANSRRVVSDLGRFFPPAPNQFVLGPMAKLNWGSPPLVTATIGILLELPNPVRIVLVGQLSMTLPDAKKAVVDLKVDILGTLDFARRELAIDAVLRDSRIAAFTVAGDLAVRANFGQHPELVVAVGGLHPRFPPPANFPRLKRLSIALAVGDFLRLRLEAYQAITPNTAQIGARLELYVELGPFSIEGYFGFDALLQLAPFAFLVDVHAGVALRWGGTPLFGIRLECSLSGPAPTRIVGEARFDFFGTHTIPIDHTFGVPEPLLPPELVDVAARLLEALADPVNWQALLPADTSPVVTVRERDRDGDAGLVLHPLDAIAVHQRVVPLELEITRFGSAQLVGEERSFQIDRVLVGDQPASLAPVTDQFSLAQFLDMSDAQKLAAPSFQPFVVGKRVETARFSLPTAGQTGHLAVDFDYDEAVFDGEPANPVEVGRARHTPTNERLLAMAAAGAAGLSELRSTGAAQYAATAMAISLVEPAWIITAGAEPTPAASFAARFDHGIGYGQSAALLRRLRADQPGLAASLRLTATYEALP
jgi:hypothetical protein